MAERCNSGRYPKAEYQLSANDGSPINHEYIEAEANQVGISLRTGCFCNPGASEIALELKQPDLIACFSREEFQQRLKQGLEPA